MPKSVVKSRAVTGDVNNLIVFPKSLNNARSNLKYVESIPESQTPKPIFACSKCSNCPGCPNVGLLSKAGFVPPDLWKGKISRAVIRMVDRHPKYKKIIHKQVLDIHTAYKWNRQFPPDISELEWQHLIKSNSKR